MLGHRLPTRECVAELGLAELENLEVMARQYLGCPASSASVERLFSKVGIAFAAKRKSADAGTLEDLMFALNL